MTQKTKTSIQERMQNKAFEALGEVEHQIDRLLDKKKSSFSMYKYLKRIDYSGRVVSYMKGFAKNTSLGNGISNIGARSKFATNNPKINPIDLLISKSVGIVLI